MEQLIVRHRQLLANLQTKFSREMLDQIQWSEQLIGIKGSRGVGKSTMCLQYIKNKYGIDSSCLYVSMDNVAFPYANLLELAENFVIRGGKHLFIDEIHKYPQWIAELKNIYDFYPQLKVVFTGSSVLQLDNSKADLSRRAVMYNMFGLSFREFLEIETGIHFEKYTLAEILTKHETIAFQIISKIRPLQYFEQYLKFGYYPYYLQSAETYSIKLSQLIQQVIEEDLPQLSRIEFEHISKLKRFIFLLSQYVPFKPNYTKLGETIQVTRQTITNYLHLLAQAGLLKILYTDQHNISSLAKPQKILLQHPNYYFALSGEVKNKGSLRETFLVNQLSVNNIVETSEIGDFRINYEYLFEIGGKNKGYKQIANRDKSFVVIDDTELGIGNKIPLWLFGFLY